MKGNSALAALGALSMLAACSSATQSGAAASTSSTSRANNAATLRWSGSFAQSQQQTGDLAPRSTNKVYGNVSLTRPRDDQSSVHAKVTLSTPLGESRLLHWAILDGSCGSNTLPLLAIEQFPQINITNNGRGQIDVDLPLTLMPTGSYHVDVYWTTGHDHGDLMTCANLRLDGAR
jgi:hypothetical protein